MYNAIMIAEYIIHESNKRHEIINNFKLNSILYFIQAEFVVETGEKCFEDEIQAWAFGAVIPSVYRKYKFFGSAHIPASASEDCYYIQPEDKKKITAIIEICSKFSSPDLLGFIRNQEPWKKAYKTDKVITTYSLAEFFRE